MLAGFQHAHGVHKPVGALLRHHVPQILVVLQHGEVVAGVVHGDGRVAALHLLEHLVHDEGLVHAVVLGVLQKLERLGELLLVGGVDIIAQVQQRRRQGIAGVVDHQHLAGIFGVKHGVPACDGLVHHGLVVNDAQAAPGIGHGVLVLRVVAQMGELLPDELEVGNVVVVQLRQTVLLNEAGNHIVGGHDHVEVRAAHGDQAVQRLVALGGLIVDVDAGGLLKLGDQLLVDILTPGAHVHHGPCVGAAAGDNQHRQQSAAHGAGHHPHPDGHLAVGAPGEIGHRSRRAAAIRLPLHAGLPDIHDGQQQQHRHKQQRGNGVDLRADTLLGHAVDGHGQGRRAGAGGKVGDDEVVDGHGESRQRAGHDAGLDLGDNHLPEGLHPGAAQVLGRVHQVPVHLPQLGAHGQNDVGDVEHHVGNQQRAEAHGQLFGQHHGALPGVDPPGKAAPPVEEHHKQQRQADAGDNIGVHHGDVVHRHQRVPPSAAHGVKADGGKGARDGGDHRGQQAHQQRDVHAAHDDLVVEQLSVPVEGEALPHAGAGALVKGENNQDKDGRIQEQRHQRHQKAVEKPVGLLSLHSITACSSPSPKRFITSMHTTTMIIITRLMAAPSWGL